jgi:hypothetical protein
MHTRFLWSVEDMFKCFTDAHNHSYHIVSCLEQVAANSKVGTSALMARTYPSRILVQEASVLWRQLRLDGRKTLHALLSQWNSR